jgi:hypothetical protein
VKEKGSGIYLSVIPGRAIGANPESRAAPPFIWIPGPALSAVPE